jgi:hypothetical protein
MPPENAASDATEPPPPATPAPNGLPPAYGGQQSARAEGTSGWEKVDKVASTGEAVASGIGTVILKIYAVALIIIGIIVLVNLDNASRFLGLLISAYGVYLVAPGSKFVIY